MMAAHNLTNFSPQDLTLQGYYLFPCKGKKPLVKWLAESTIDLATIEQWISRFPECNWGIDCGKSGIVVLDDDRGKNPKAIESMDALEFEYGPLPNTFTVRTISGGFHYYFYGEGKNSASTKLGEGLDTRGVKGYVIAPCSPGYSVVKNIPVVDSPLWFLDLIGKPIQRESLPVPENVTLDTDLAITRAINYLQTADPAIEGSGGDAQTFQVACAVRDFGISKDQCYNLMLDHYDPRCVPPWEDQLAAKVANAYSYATAPLGSKTPEAVFTEVPDDISSPPPRFKLLTRDDVSKLPPLKWHVKGLIPARGVFQIYGPSKAGKSFLAFDMLTAIAEGRAWFNHLTKPAPTVYICLEGEAALGLRQEAWEKHNGKNLPANFYMVAQPWSIVTKADVMDLANVIPKGSVVIIDTQNKAAPLIKETTSEDMGALLQGAKILETAINGAVGLVAHTGKDISKGVRGHSSQIAAMDAAIEVTRNGDLRQWRTDKVKDGRDGEKHPFYLKTIDLGIDEDGERITSCVISVDNLPKLDTKDFILSESEATAWESIKILAGKNCNREVASAAWLTQFLSQEGSAPTDKSAKNRFYKARKGLIDKGLARNVSGVFVVSALTSVIADDSDD